MTANITRDIIQDLLPVYAAGEASADTRALVERFLENEPALRNTLESAQEPLPEPAAPSDEIERRALKTIRRLLAIKGWIAPASMFLTLVPLTFGWIDGRSFRLVESHPRVALGSFLAAVAGWVAFLWVDRRLTVRGMTPRQTLSGRIAWLAWGGMLGFSGGTVLRQWAGWDATVGLTAMMAVLAVALGELLRGDHR
jgi:hypothetical protein